MGCPRVLTPTYFSRGIEPFSVQPILLVVAVTFVVGAVYALIRVLLGDSPNLIC